ncbi:MAG TPA: hypothetical protein VFB84_00240 [Micromonosporaceae bacterium]|nr:hypothetical protein [Micromonosporaceae bacterium]
MSFFEAGLLGAELDLRRASFDGATVTFLGARTHSGVLNGSMTEFRGGRLSLLGFDGDGTAITLQGAVFSGGMLLLPPSYGGLDALAAFGLAGDGTPAGVVFG